MAGGAMLGGLLCGFVLVVGLGSLIGAVILRAAIALFNKMAGASGPPSGVPEPGFGKAMGIAFLTMLANWGVGVVVGLATGGGPAAADAGAAPQAAGSPAQLISVPISFVVMAALLMAMLPTTFGKGLLVTLLYFLIAIVIVVVIAVLVALVFGVGFVRR